MGEKNKNKKLIWTIFIFIIFLLGFIGFIIYIKFDNKSIKADKNKIELKDSNSTPNLVDESKWEDFNNNSGVKTYVINFRRFKNKEDGYQSDLFDKERIDIVTDDYIGYDDYSNHYSLNDYEYDVFFTFNCEGKCEGQGYGNYFIYYDEIENIRTHYIVNKTTKKRFEIVSNANYLQYDNKLYGIFYSNEQGNIIYDDLNGNKKDLGKHEMHFNYNLLQNQIYSLGHLDIGNKIINYLTGDIIKEFDADYISVVDNFEYIDKISYKILYYYKRIDNEPITYHNYKYVDSNYKEIISEELYSQILLKNYILYTVKNDNYFYKIDLSNGNKIKSSKYKYIYTSEFIVSNKQNISYIVVGDDQGIKILDSNESLIYTFDNNLLNTNNINNSLTYNEKIYIYTKDNYKCDEFCECTNIYIFDITTKTFSKEVSNSCSD